MSQPTSSAVPSEVSSMSTRAPQLDDEHPMTRAIVFDEPLPEPFAVGHVEARQIRMAPGFAPGAHRHNGPVFGVVLTGSVLLQVTGQPARLLGPGDAFFEPADTDIEHFDAQDDGAVFMAYYPLEQGQRPDIEMVD